MSKSATLMVRLEPEVKEQAEAIFHKLGLSASDAVNTFYRQTIRMNGMPYELRDDAPVRIDITNWPKEKLDKELKNAARRAEKEEGRPAALVHRELEEKYFA